MSGEPDPTTSNQEMHEQASPSMQSHVNSIKSKLGLDNEKSPLGRLAAHTRRKLTELEAARAAGITAAPGSPDWQAAMKPESFSKGFIRANRTQFLITAGVFSLGLFWLLVIRFVHHNDNQNQTGNSEVAQKALAARQAAGLSPQQVQQMEAQRAAQAGAMPGSPLPNASFGSPNGGFGSPRSAEDNQPGVAGNTDGGMPAGVVGGMPVGVVGGAPAPQSYAQPTASYGQAAISLPQSPGYTQPNSQPYAQAAPAYGVNPSVGSYGAPQTHNLYPSRQHNVARHQVVVNR